MVVKTTRRKCEEKRVPPGAAKRTQKFRALGSTSHCTAWQRRGRANGEREEGKKKNSHSYLGLVLTTQILRFVIARIALLVYTALEAKGEGVEEVRGRGQGREVGGGWERKVE